jgi:hypothetical protein
MATIRCYSYILIVTDRPHFADQSWIPENANIVSPKTILQSAIEEIKNHTQFCYDDPALVILDTFETGYWCRKDVRNLLRLRQESYKVSVVVNGLPRGSGAIKSATTHYFVHKSRYNLSPSEVKYIFRNVKDFSHFIEKHAGESWDYLVYCPNQKIEFFGYCDDDDTEETRTLHSRWVVRTEPFDANNIRKGSVVLVDSPHDAIVQSITENILDKIDFGHRLYISAEFPKACFPEGKNFEWCKIDHLIGVPSILGSKLVDTPSTEIVVVVDDSTILRDPAVDLDVALSYCWKQNITVFLQSQNVDRPIGFGRYLTHVFCEKFHDLVQLDLVPQSLDAALTHARKLIGRNENILVCDIYQGRLYLYPSPVENSTEKIESKKIDRTEDDAHQDTSQIQNTSNESSAESGDDETLYALMDGCSGVKIGLERLKSYLRDFWPVGDRIENSPA